MRGLACDTPHEAAREFLIDLFEELRAKFVQWRKVHKVSKKKVPPEDRLNGFLLCFFRVQGILYTRVGIDELDELFEQQFLHFGQYLYQIESE